ncbi:MAG: hypothetical protein HKM04_09210 [Legionellales bacterium]|nr:hypothetical protein [Legionellales bacterium]
MPSIKPFFVNFYAKTKTKVLTPFEWPSRMRLAFENRPARQDLASIRNYLCEERADLRENLIILQKKLELQQKQYQRKVMALKKQDITMLALASEKTHLAHRYDVLTEEIDELKRFSFRDIESLSELRATWLSGMIKRINQAYGYHLDAYTRTDEKNRQAALTRFLSINDGWLSEEEKQQFKREANYHESSSSLDEWKVAHTEEEIGSESQTQNERRLPESIIPEAGVHWPHRLDDSANPSSYSGDDDEHEWPRRLMRASH